MDEKSSLRKQLIKKRLELDPQTREREAKSICSYLKEHPMVQATDVILLYASKDPEVSLDELGRWALSCGKKLGFPKVYGQDMHFYFVRELSELQAGYFGVREPLETCEPAVFKKAVCLVPGVGFDISGNRMGYGKGFYDRFFAKTTADIFKIGIGYDIQLLDAIPATEQDVKMDQIVSSSHIIDIVLEKGHRSIWI